jgi:hypothetical protein
MAASRVHRNLTWLVGEPKALALLAADRELSKWIVAMVAPGLYAVTPRDAAKVAARLEKLGRPARLVGARK